MAKVPIESMICGVDAGGTHTRYVVMNDNGEVCFTLSRPSMHFMKNGYSAIAQELATFKEIAESHGVDTQSLKIVLGVAGYGRDQLVCEQIEKQITSVFPDALIMNDAQLAHYAIFKGQDGTLVISGTGSIALRKLGNDWQRSGGFGYMIDDAGSGFWIGKELLNAFVRQSDGRLTRGKLYEKVKATLNITSEYELIRLVNDHKQQYRNWVASFAGQYSDVDDPAVFDILTRAGKECAYLANAFNVSQPTYLSISGSVLLNNETVRKSFITHVDHCYKFIENKTSAEFGALWVLRFPRV